MAKIIFTECSSCAVRMEWAPTAEDPLCELCGIKRGKDVGKLIGVYMAAPTPKNLELVLNKFLSRIEAIEMKDLVRDAAATVKHENT